MQEAVKPLPHGRGFLRTLGFGVIGAVKTLPSPQDLLLAEAASSRHRLFRRPEAPTSSPQGKPPSLTEAAIAKHIIPAHRPGALPGGDTYPPTPSRCSSGKVTAGGKGIPAGQAAIGRLDAIRRRRRRGGSGGGDCQVFTKYCVNRVDFVKALWERVQGRGDYLTVAATNSVPVEY